MLTRSAPLARIVFIGLLLTCQTPALSQVGPAVEDTAAIDRAVAAFTGQPVGAPGGAARPVDRRLRLNACAAPLALSWRGDGHATVLIQCPDAAGWHIYAAVAGPARQAAAGSTGTVPTVAGPDAAAVVIERGQSVTVAVTGEGFSVSQSAEALEPGAIGAWIHVRTLAKADPVQARVVRPGLVEVPVE